MLPGTQPPVQSLVCAWLRPSAVCFLCAIYVNPVRITMSSHDIYLIQCLQALSSSRHHSIHLARQCGHSLIAVHWAQAEIEVRFQRALHQPARPSPSYSPKPLPSLLNSLSPASSVRGRTGLHAATRTRQPGSAAIQASFAALGQRRLRGQRQKWNQLPHFAG